MSRVRLVCALMLCVLAMPTAAGAQDGNGPYAPFPSAPDDGAGNAWYALIGVDIPREQLEQGAFAGALRPAVGAAPGAASARAGVDGTGVGALLGALALVTIGCGAGAVAARRRSSSPPQERT